MKNQPQQQANGEKGKCLNPSCSREAQTRGLCTSCYSAAGALVKSGRVTWEQLVAHGKAKEAVNRKGTGTIQSWLLSEIDEAELGPRATAQQRPHRKTAAAAA